MTGGEGRPRWDEEGKLDREGLILGPPASGRKPLVATAQSLMGESPTAAGPTGEKGRQCRVKRTNLCLMLLLPPAFLRPHLSLVVLSPGLVLELTGCLHWDLKLHSIQRGVGLGEHWLFASLHPDPSSGGPSALHIPLARALSHTALPVFCLPR